MPNPDFSNLMNTFQKHIEEIIGGVFGLGGGLKVITLSQPEIEFLTAVFTAFACGVAGAIGGYLFKIVVKFFTKLFTKRKKES